MELEDERLPYKMNLLSDQFSVHSTNIIGIGGLENMLIFPKYSTKARLGFKMGHDNLVEGILKYGLWEVFDDRKMGNYAIFQTNFNSVDQTNHLSYFKVGYCVVSITALYDRYKGTLSLILKIIRTFFSSSNSVSLSAKGGEWLAEGHWKPPLPWPPPMLTPPLPPPPAIVDIKSLNRWFYFFPP